MSLRFPHINIIGYDYRIYLLLFNLMTILLGIKDEVVRTGKREDFFLVTRTEHLFMQIFALRNIHYGVLFELLWVTVEDDVVGLMLLFQVAHITSLDSL